MFSISLIFLLCFTVDPLWCFTHKNQWNTKQISFNERQQKSDYLAVRKNNYEILILGSSRTTFLDANDINGYKAFNFAANAMMPDEYREYARFFKKHNQQTPSIILVGLDFYSTNRNFHGYNYLAPTEYFRNAENTLWRYSALMNFDTLKYSLKNIRQTFKTSKLDYYDRNAVKSAVSIPQIQKKHFIDKDLIMFKRDFYGQTYKYRDLKNIYIDFLEDNPKTKIVLFTTPDSLPLWQLLLEEGRLEDYLRWLGDIVTVFGEVYDFMGDNDFTSNPENYMDAHHFYPRAGKTITSKIFSAVPTSIGTLVTRKNYIAYTDSIRAKYSHRKP